MLSGANVIVLDLEILRSAQDCRYCGQHEAEHYADGACQNWSGLKPADERALCHRIGWNNHALLGISIGCYYDYADDHTHYFDQHTLEATMRQLVERQPLLVSYNGKQFDLPLMEACSLFTDGGTPDTVLWHWRTLSAQSYDILHEIWQMDPSNKCTKGNGLDAVSQANGYGAKEMDGATAPLLWRQGLYARVIDYCTSDVWKTRKLFEQVCRGEPIKRSMGDVLLPLPQGVTV